MHTLYGHSVNETHERARLFAAMHVKRAVTSVREAESNLEEVDGILGVHIFCEIEFEVKLIAKDGGSFALVVHERDTELDDFEQVDVATQQLILIIRSGAEFSDRSGHDSREFRVHRDVTKFLLGNQFNRWQISGIRVYPSSR